MSESASKSKEKDETSNPEYPVVPDGLSAEKAMAMLSIVLGIAAARPALRPLLPAPTPLVDAEVDMDMSAATQEWPGGVWRTVKLGVVRVDPPLLVPMAEMVTA